jgi:hypothetical protein
MNLEHGKELNSDFMNKECRYYLIFPENSIRLS